MQNEREELEWFSARSVFRFEDHDNRGSYLFEERVVLLRANSFDEAMDRAEKSARSYARESGYEWADQFVDLYRSHLDVLEDGDEVFSLLRESELPVVDYVTRFFSTGRERAEQEE